MPRFSVAVLLGLVLASSVRAQAPVDDMTLPKPTPVVQETAAPESDPTPLALTDDAVRGNGWRFWTHADYALAWLSSKNLPALATTSPDGTARPLAGVLGVPGTTAVIGGTPNTEELRSMGRLGAGVWFDRESTLGAEAGFFVTEGKDNQFSASSDGTTILGRPFVDAASGVPTALLVGFPGVSSGSVNVVATSATCWGANVNLRENVVAEPWLRLDSIFGYRYLHFGESLAMQQTLVGIGAPFVPGTTFDSRDSFQTTNDFHGVDFGFRTELLGERVSLELLTKLAAGRIQRETIIAGSTRLTVPGVAGVTVSQGGVYALSSNIGTQSTSGWVVAPELGLTGGYQLNDNIRFRLGYSVLFISRVARAADQIDFTVNQNLLPPSVGGGPNRPAVEFRPSEVWLQSISVGVEFRY